jgi:DNA/RNA-binding domain of Phe-tRNA-synthetase-like protein
MVNFSAKRIGLVTLLLVTLIAPVTATESASAANQYSPHWVKNCIQVYSQINQTFMQQCDQAYATAPGRWVKNCIQVYNQVFKTFEQQCAQAYAIGNGTGSWTKNCIQVYNQAFKTFEQKCQQTYLQR